MKARIPDGKSFSEKRMAEIEKLMEHPLNADDKFLFRCKQCGGCCRDRNDILLSPFDIYRMAKQIDKLPEDVIYDYGHVYIGQTSKIPLVSLKMRADNNECPFLKNGRCKIHKGKPAACALFPLGRFAARKDENNVRISYILQPVDCGARDEEHTVREWMRGFDLEESEQYFFEWQDKAMKLSERMNKIMDDIPPRVQEMMINQIIHFVYACYDVEKPIMPQFERNWSHTELLLNTIENKLAELIIGDKNEKDTNSV